MTDDHPALTHSCPDCSAHVGKPCVSRQGKVQQPHLRRVALTEVSPWSGHGETPR